MNLDDTAAILGTRGGMRTLALRHTPKQGLPVKSSPWGTALNPTTLLLLGASLEPLFSSQITPETHLSLHGDSVSLILNNLMPLGHSFAFTRLGTR